MVFTSCHTNPVHLGSIEDNTKKLQRKDLSRKERLATRLLISEQKILQGTVDAVRKYVSKSDFEQ